MDQTGKWSAMAAKCPPLLTRVPNNAKRPLRLPEGLIAPPKQRTESWLKESLHTAKVPLVPLQTGATAARGARGAGHVPVCPALVFALEDIDTSM